MASKLLDSKNWIGKNNKILVIVGPTATGKSDLAVTLAKKYKGEVISADSRQVYRGLNIGTGKITKKEMSGVPHHLLDVISPKKRFFSVSEWKKLAENRIEEIFSRGNLPIICGGTGLYVRAIVDNLVLPEVPPNPSLRKKLATKSAQELFNILKKLDQKRARTIERENPVRLIRAIEIAQILGKVPPLRLNQNKKYEFLEIGLHLPDTELKKRIHARLLARMKKGMINEARKLQKGGLSWNRMNELGLEYRYLAQFLQEKISKEEFLKKLENEIWQYSKRQITWFKKDNRIKWFSPHKTKAIETEVAKFLKS